jgi:hypothetical protein
LGFAKNTDFLSKVVASVYFHACYVKVALIGITYLLEEGGRGWRGKYEKIN